MIAGYVLLFLLVVASVMAAALVYEAVRGSGTAVVSAVMLLIILALAAVCTLSEAAWRHFMIDRPAAEILAATDRIAAGDFSVRLKCGHLFGAYDDFDEIKENINRMAEALSRDEVLKTDFVSNVSHELKTPLAVIRSYAALLQDPTLSGEERERCVRTISRTAERMGALVGNVLTLSRMDSQSIAPPAEEVSLEAAAGECVLRYTDAAESKGIELTCDLEDVRVRTVPAYLETVCANLVSNAVKFTPEGGKVCVTARKEGDFALIRVADTGCGMDAETASRIFDRFYQGDSSHAQEGNGLGLALVKRAVELLGGEIGVESAPGRGSVFTVRLRLSDGGEEEKG